MRAGGARVPLRPRRLTGSDPLANRGPLRPAGAALALSGWAPSASDLSEGEQTAADVLPEDVAVAGDGWDTSTSRLPAIHDGQEFDVTGT